MWTGFRRTAPPGSAAAVPGLVPSEQPLMHRTAGKTEASVLERK